MPGVRQLPAMNSSWVLRGPHPGVRRPGPAQGGEKRHAPAGRSSHAPIPGMNGEKRPADAPAPRPEPADEKSVDMEGTHMPVNANEATRPPCAACSTGTWAISLVNLPAGAPAPVTWQASSTRWQRLHRALPARLRALHLRGSVLPEIRPVPHRQGVPTVPPPRAGRARPATDQSSSSARKSVPAASTAHMQPGAPGGRLGPPGLSYDHLTAPALAAARAFLHAPSVKRRRVLRPGGAKLLAVAVCDAHILHVRPGRPVLRPRHPPGQQALRPRLGDYWAMREKST